MVIAVSRGILTLLGFLFVSFYRGKFYRDCLPNLQEKNNIVQVSSSILELFQFKMCNVGGSKYKKTPKQHEQNPTLFISILFMHRILFLLGLVQWCISLHGSSETGRAVLY